MRTAAWSLALLAGASSAFAGESGEEWRANNPDWTANPWAVPASQLAAQRVTVTSTIKSTVTVCPCVETSSSIASAPQYSVTRGSGGRSGGGSGVSASESWSSDTDVTQTVVTSSWTTVCPVTETLTTSGTTLTSLYSTVSTVTSTSTIYPSSSPKSPVSSSPSSVVSSASVTTITSHTTFTSLYTVTASGTTTVETHTLSRPVVTTSTCTESKSTGTKSVGPPYPYSSKSGSSSVPYLYSSRSGFSSVPAGTGSSPSKPIPTGSTGSTCIRCEGNPGNDEFCGYTLEDNYYEVIPNTCKTVEYNFTITETQVAPDGVSRIGLVVNGQMPGPLIEASWGDWIVLHVHNQMPLNGSSIHFHGVRQNYTNEMDGVPAITQCPLAPGESQTYKFRATNYGTSWWHSHFAVQAYEGVFGPLAVHGPNSGGSYDGEQVIVLQDWSHATADELLNPSEVVTAGARGGAPTLDNGLINGLNVWGADGSAAQSGKRFEMSVKKGQTYRLRIINSAIASTFKFFIDDHKFKVIAADFVPIEPYETEIVNINIGQRYDLLVTFDQPVGNYWLRSANQASCNTIVQQGNIKGIVRYEGASSTGLPTTNPYTFTDECVDEPIASLVPVVALDAGAVSKTIDETVSIGPNGKSPNLFKWTLSGTTFQSQWGAPTLQQIYENGTVPTFSGQLAVDVPKLGEWVYIIIDTPLPVTHPVHLHGHDFMLLAQGVGTYDSSTVTLNLKNPARRDVANMPANGKLGQGGYIVIAFQSDNPGIWLLHCHIGWHVAMGFALQIIENLEGIKDTVTHGQALEDTCSTWNTYGDANNIFAAPWESGV